MALSGLFLLTFIAQHLSINLLSVFSEKAFNSASHFMGTFWAIQFVAQPILTAGFLFHIVMGIYLELQNRKARPIGYEGGNKAIAPWASKNMIITGVMVLLFLIFHFIDFWIPEIDIKYFSKEAGVSLDQTGYIDGELRYYDHLRHMFESPIRTVFYALSFVFLGLHLSHGFQSAFQSIGANHSKYTPLIKKTGMAFSYAVPILFTIIAVYHFVDQL